MALIIRVTVYRMGRWCPGLPEGWRVTQHPRTLRLRTADSRGSVSVARALGSRSKGSPFILTSLLLFAAAGYKNDEAYFLSPGQHCVRKLDLETRQTSTFSGDCDESGFTDGPALNAR